jgi:hypothetical protein
LNVEYIGATGKFIRAGIIDGCFGIISSFIFAPMQWMVLLLYDEEGLAILAFNFKISFFSSFGS